MKRYLKALWSKDVISCLTGGAIFCGAFYGATGAALGAWCVTKREKLECK